MGKQKKHKDAPAPSEATIRHATFEESFALSKIVKAEYNPRVIDDDGKRKLRASLDRFGMVEHLVVNKRANGMYVLVGGHQRYDALLESGAKTAPVSVVVLDDTSEKALNLHLNGHAGRFDRDLLKDVLDDLTKGGEDLTMIELDNDPEFRAAQAIIAAEQSHNNTSFLDKFLNKDTDNEENYNYDPAKAGERIDLGGVTRCAFALDEKQRDTFLDAVNAAKAAAGVETTGEAVVHILEAFVGGDLTDADEQAAAELSAAENDDEPEDDESEEE